MSRFEPGHICLISEPTESLRSTVKCAYVVCGKEYIGQTADLRSRLTLHRQRINNEEYCHLPVTKHMRQCAVSLNPSFKIFPVYKILDGNQPTPDVKETFQQQVQAVSEW